MSNSATDSSFRDQMVTRLRQDTVGPLAPNEQLRTPNNPDLPSDGKPTDRYLTGILWPQGCHTEDDGDDLQSDELSALGSNVEESDEPGEPPANSKPTTCGVSFAIRSESAVSKVRIEVSGARYLPCWIETRKEDGQEILHEDEEAPKDNDSQYWQRHALSAKLLSLQITKEQNEHLCDIRELEDHPLWTNFGLYVHWSDFDPELKLQTVTVRVINNNTTDPTTFALESERSSLFQASIQVKPGSHTELIARPSRRAQEDRDLELLYRNEHEYAVGHNCSAKWNSSDTGRLISVGTEWVPDHTIRGVLANPIERDLFLAEKTLNATWLCDAPRNDVLEKLKDLPECYESWLKEVERKEFSGLDPDLQDQAKEHFRNCHETSARIRRGIELLQQCDTCWEAFRLATKAMVKQASWSGMGQLVWRPFQLAYQLMVIESLSDPWHEDRDLMDLLWFPTGGGKTEAYLGLVAYIAFHRRLKYPNNPDQGSGVAILMRYTLRLLTLDQFRRACKLICACDAIRSEQEDQLGTVPISIGLWIGGSSTPNRREEAEEALAKEDPPSSPKQITECPCCQKTLRWYKDHQNNRISCECRNPECELGSRGTPLPIHTVDEDIYDVGPTLLLSTIDKFAQVAFQPQKVSAFFGRGGEDPPDLVLQDELHLISGPLGSLTGAYEVALDAACQRRNAQGKLSKVKIIGSTATIKRAPDQVRALYDRDARQFPPSVLNWDRSYFMMPDEKGTRPTRRYTAISSIGRSPKFTLQFVYGSLLLSGKSIQCTPDENRDPWWSLLGYFNALRELGGSMVMLDDDVGDTMTMLATNRRELVTVELGNGKIKNIPPRAVQEHAQLTSRVPQTELKEIFSDLDQVQYPNEAAFDAVLATNMVSVGVDIDRLGLMCVFAQPKQIAEYIQATSRVGRKHPGLVVTVYKHNFARDRAFYETYLSWMKALYRDVEPTSVTPFASRTRDRVLAALTVAMACLPLEGEAPLIDPNNPLMSEQIKRRILKERFPLMQKRINAIENDGGQTANQAKADLKRVLDEWHDRSIDWEAQNIQPTIRPRPSGRGSGDSRLERLNKSVLIAYEDFHSTDKDLLDSREDLVAPNSMRNVDNGSPVKFAAKVSRGEDEEGGSDGEE